MIWEEIPRIIADTNKIWKLTMIIRTRSKGPWKQFLNIKTDTIITRQIKVNIKELNNYSIIKSTMKERWKIDIDKMMNDFQITTWIILNDIWIGVDKGIGTATLLSPRNSYILSCLKVPKFHKITFWHL